MYQTIKEKIKKILPFLSGAPKRYTYLFTAIRKIKPKNIMEIGTWNGNRAEQMIETAQKFWPVSEITYYGFDLFEEMMKELITKEVIGEAQKLRVLPPMEEVRKKLIKTGAKINLFKGNTLKVLPEVIHSLPKMDFIFIDGGHSIETITNDWHYSQQLMVKNTVVIFDDYYFNKDDIGAKTVIEKIDGNQFYVKILPIKDQFNNKSGLLSINFVMVKRCTKKIN